jgi:hypothetical protein
VILVAFNYLGVEVAHGVSVVDSVIIEAGRRVAIPQVPACQVSQAAVGVKLTSTPAITIIVASVIATKGKTKCLLHVVTILEVHTQIERFEAQEEFHGVVCG